MSENIETQTARTVAPFPVLMLVPDDDDAQELPLPLRVWSALRGYVLEATDNAEYKLERLGWELDAFAPRAVAWARAEAETEAAHKAGERESCDPFNENAEGDEEDWNNWRNRSVELLTAKLRHEATLARLGFWRRASLFGVSGAELDFARQKEMLLLAGEVCKRYDIEVIPNGLTIAEMLETMDTRDLNDE